MKALAGMTGLTVFSCLKVVFVVTCLFVCLFDGLFVPGTTDEWTGRYSRHFMEAEITHIYYSCCWRLDAFREIYYSK